MITKNYETRKINELDSLVEVEIVFINMWNHSKIHDFLNWVNARNCKKKS